MLLKSTTMYFYDSEKTSVGKATSPCRPLAALPLWPWARQQQIALCSYNPNTMQDSLCNFDLVLTIYFREIVTISNNNNI